MRFGFSSLMEAMQLRLEDWRVFGAFLSSVVSQKSWIHEVMNSHVPSLVSSRAENFTFLNTV